MSRNKRAELARQTLSILEAGKYMAPNGTMISLGGELARCLETTHLFGPEELERGLNKLDAKRSGIAPKIEAINETTLKGIAELLREGAAPVLALNFASAKNPGGGFLGGSQAQEESLARSSGLHSSLMKAWSYYEQHRASSSCLYSDALILSPACPVFRDDEGNLLEQVQEVSFISCAAPNMGAMQSNNSDEIQQIPETFLRRCRYILAVAASHNYRAIVLGAWGCGVFRNDPKLVAATFAHLLFEEQWAAYFSRIRFSVLDTSPSKDIIKAFEQFNV